MRGTCSAVQYTSSRWPQLKTCACAAQSTSKAKLLGHARSALLRSRLPREQLKTASVGLGGPARPHLVHFAPRGAGAALDQPKQWRHLCARVCYSAQVARVCASEPVCARACVRACLCVCLCARAWESARARVCERVLQSQRQMYSARTKRYSTSSINLGCAGAACYPTTDRQCRPGQCAPGTVCP